MNSSLPAWFRRLGHTLSSTPLTPRVVPEATPVPRPAAPTDRVVLLIACQEMDAHAGEAIRRKGATVVRVDTLGFGVGPYSGSAASAVYLDRQVAEALPTDLVVCGHVQCQALQAIVDRSRLPADPAVDEPAAATLLRQHYANLTGRALWEAAAQEHVLAQLGHLEGYPAVRALRKQPRLSALLHDERADGYLLFNPRSGQFETITPPPEWSPELSPWARGCP